MTLTEDMADDIQEAQNAIQRAENALLAGRTNDALTYLEEADNTLDAWQ